MMLYWTALSESESGGGTREEKGREILVISVIMNEDVYVF